MLLKKLCFFQSSPKSQQILAPFLLEIKGWEELSKMPILVPLIEAIIDVNITDDDDDVSWRR